jgi:tripartite-type tricarboxylate transporter receptor subunit TctC
MTGCHVIIIGAGIGGLAAALSLHRHGMRVSVYEQAPELREFGAGLMVTPNAMHALDFLGVGDVIAATSNVSAGLLIKQYRTGEVLRSISERDIMKLRRRQFLHLAAGAAALPVASRIAWAQTYPTRLVRFVVGGPPGGPQDILARLMGQWLSERLGQPFVIDNRPGAGTNIAAEAVVRAPADGYTLLMIGAANAINATLYEKLNFNFMRDIAPVAGITRQTSVMEVHPSVPAKTVPEFIAYAKANPGKINMASAGNGTPPHIAGELFKMMTGIDMLHVPYRGGAPALTDLLGGQVDVMFDSIASSIEYIRAGKLRALAVTTTTRSEGSARHSDRRGFCAGL